MPEQTWRNNPDITPERKLDGIIDEEVIQYQGEEVILNGVAVKRWRAWPHYSTDIEAAWKVVEAMEARGWLLELQRYPAHWLAGFYRWNSTAAKHYFPGTAPLAIAKAALAAQEATQ